MSALTEGQGGTTMTQGDVLSNNGSTPLSTTTHISPTTDGGSEEQMVDNPTKRPMLTDTLAAVTIAILAVALVITLTLIVRAVRRRRRLQRGEELDRIPTVSAGIMSANVAAYSRNQRTHQPQRDVIVWEPITPSSSSAPVASTSAVRGMPRSHC